MSQQQSKYTHLSHVSRSYSIRKQRNSHRYRVTIPADNLNEIGVENGDELGFWIKTNSDGRLQLVYETDISKCDIITSVSKHSSGELTIPSAVGATAVLGEESVVWDTYECSDGSYTIIGTTTKQLESYETESNLYLANKPLRHTEQDVEHEGKEWEQEHFQLYIPVGDAEELGWLDGEMIGLVLVSVDGNVGIKYTRRNDTVPEKAQKKVQKTGEYQRDRIAYTPNGLVRSMRIVNAPVDMYATNAGSLLLRR